MFLFTFFFVIVHYYTYSNMAFKTLPELELCIRKLVVLLSNVQTLNGFQSQVQFLLIL